MRIYIFRNCKVSTRYHSSGGLIVIAPNVTRVMELIDLYNQAQHSEDPDDDYHTGETDIELTNEDYDNAIRYPIDAPEQVIVFPDGGCC